MKHNLKELKWYDQMIVCQDKAAEVDEAVVVVEQVTSPQIQKNVRP